MAGPLGPFKHYAYVSDNGSTYTIRERGAVGDAVSNTSEAVGAHPTHPAGMQLRHVYGAALSASPVIRKKAIICDPSNALYTTGGTFSVDGLTFTVEGRIGEKRRTV